MTKTSLTPRLRGAAAAAAAILCTACASAEADSSFDGARELVVTAAEFAFWTPDTVRAGLTRVRLINTGREMHHLQLVRLADGHTVRELIDRLVDGESEPPWATFVGGPSVPPTGGESEVTVALEPGRYALLCFIPSKDRAPHFMKGMVRELTVLPAAGYVREPAADARMVLDDYSFTLTAPLRAGRRTIRVENVAEQGHEVFIARLAPGKTAEDVPRWFRQADQPLPFTPVGGAMELSKGAVNYVTVELTPGEYALICFVPAQSDGKSHVAHGMIRQIRVE